tara:strand:+ start:844 stop:1470 length:627 start_codon:yes stop_codon:yes gene_type:complete
MLDFDYILMRMREPELRASLIDREIDKYQNWPYRDSIFEGILKSFGEKPIRVFQVGAIESLETKFRLGSGWSEFFWGEYIREYGGSLHICDINMNHIAHSNFAASNLRYQVNLHVDDAAQCLLKMFANDSECVPFDIYYLDGADEPHGNQQTLDQFKIIEDHKALVLVDDVPTKGQLLLEYLDNGYGWKSVAFYNNVGNGMMAIDMRK